MLSDLTEREPLLLPVTISYLPIYDRLLEEHHENAYGQNPRANKKRWLGRWPLLALLSVGVIVRLVPDWMRQSQDQMLVGGIIVVALHMR